MPFIDDLPYELLSSILLEAAELNAADSVSYTYGLSQAPLLLRASRLEKCVRGQVPTDVQRWKVTHDIRGVSRRWHDWALSYSLRELYIRKWRGSER
jgi:hypothetical protein